MNQEEISDEPLENYLSDTSSVSYYEDTQSIYSSSEENMINKSVIAHNMPKRDNREAYKEREEPESDDEDCLVIDEDYIPSKNDAEQSYQYISSGTESDPNLQTTKSILLSQQGNELDEGASTSGLNHGKNQKFDEVEIEEGEIVDDESSEEEKPLYVRRETVSSPSPLIKLRYEADRRYVPNRRIANSTQIRSTDPFTSINRNSSPINQNYFENSRRRRHRGSDFRSRRSGSRSRSRSRSRRRESTQIKRRMRKKHY